MQELFSIGLECLDGLRGKLDWLTSKVSLTLQVSPQANVLNLPLITGSPISAVTA